MLLLQPQRVNYLLGALGELVQRMDDSASTYGLAFPDNRQYRVAPSRGCPRSLSDERGLKGRGRADPFSWFMTARKPLVEWCPPYILQFMRRSIPRKPVHSRGTRCLPHEDSTYVR